MHKFVALMLAVLTVVMVSGCALVSRHTVPTENGTKTSLGFLGFDAIDNGEPMIPFYMWYNEGK